ncbi:MAG: hypothetical protein ACLVJH_17455 [Faecalibacterium prausnitzii]
MECAPHRIWKKLMALVLSLVLMAVMLPGALAVDLNVDAGFYFKQSRGGTCTLASAAMMLRRRAFLDGLTDWTDVTENSVRGSAWAGGLSHSFNYNAMQVGYSTLPSNNEAKKAVLIQLLAEHPEGIVLYDRRQPHAVLLTDYTDGVFYCSDRRRQRLVGPCADAGSQHLASQVPPATGTYLPTTTALSQRWTASVWKECATRSTSAPARA